MLLEQVGLADRAKDVVASFSKGMIQRLGLAQALLNEPDLLVLDEPNEGLDLIGRRIVADTIKAQREQGRSVILVSHVLHEVEQLCDRIAVLQEGKVAFLGPVSELTGRGSPDGKVRSLEQATSGNLPEGGQMRLAALRWLVADTFRQSFGFGVFWLMLGVTALAVLFALVSGFTRLGADEPAVRSTQFALAGLGANTIGLLLALYLHGRIPPRLCRSGGRPHPAGQAGAPPVNVPGQVPRRVGVFYNPGRRLLPRDMDLLRPLHGVLAEGIFRSVPGAGTEFHRLLQFLGAARRDDPKHGRVRLWLGRVLAHLRSDEPRPACADRLRSGAILHGFAISRRGWLLATAATGRHPRSAP